MVHLTFASNSGAARYVASLVEAQTQLLGETALICPPDFVFAGALRASGTKVHNIVPTVRHRDPLRFLLENAICSLVAAIRVALLRKSHSTLHAGYRSKDRVLHANFLGPPLFSLPAVALLRMCGFRIIFTVHDVLPHVWLFPRRLRAAERWTHSLLYGLADRLIVLHSGAAEDLLREFGIARHRIAVIPHGTFQLCDAPVPMPENGEITALLFGNLRRNKGIALAIEAVQKLRGHGVPIRLRIVGSPSRKERTYWEKCKAKIATRPEGIEVREEFVLDQEIAQELQRCHFMLLPYSDFGSQSGVASLALSNGRCIVATRAGGLGELVSSEMGLEIERATVNDVASALERAMRLGTDGLTELGLRARAIFSENYSWASIAVQHLRVYRGIASGAGLPTVMGRVSASSRPSKYDSGSGQVTCTKHTAKEPPVSNVR